MINYQHTNMLHKLYNDYEPEQDWQAKKGKKKLANFLQALSQRQNCLNIVKYYMKIGKIILTNNLHKINNMIDLTDLNDSLLSFKVKYKRNFYPPQNPATTGQITSLEIY